MSEDAVIDLSGFDDVELLRELIRRNGVHQGPSKTEYANTIRQTLVGIGPDNTATIRLHAEDVEALGLK